MAARRPRQPSDPSIMASVSSAPSSASRPGLISRLWHWRYERGLVAGVLLGAIAIGGTLGPGWLVATAAAMTAVLAAALAYPASRRRVIARAWCVITPHRVRAGCRHAWVQTRDGRLPVILYTMSAAFGERVTLWCQAGITHGDLEAARDVLRAACWASDVRVVACARYAQVVVLEVIRHLRAGPPPGEAVSPWPYTSPGGEAGGADPEEPAWSAGLGHHRPFG